MNPGTQPPRVRCCLASSSPRRVDLLLQAEVEFFVSAPPDVETADSRFSPQDLAAINARRKAEHVFREHPDCIVIGADTVVSSGGEIFGKPADLADAHRMLDRLGGDWHEVFTAVCVIGHGGLGRSPVQEPRIHEFVECSRVLLQKFTVRQREEYFSMINPLDKAGAYAAQDSRSGLVEKIEGSVSNVIGLPLEKLIACLRENFPEIFRDLSA